MRDTNTILTALKAGTRYTRDEVEDLRSTLAGHVESSEEWDVTLGALAKIEMPELDMDKLNTITIVTVDGIRVNPLAAMTDAIEAVQAAHDTVEQIQESLENFRGAVTYFEDQSEAWLDKSADPDDRKEARDEMEGVASELVDRLGELEQFGIEL